MGARWLRSGREGVGCIKGGRNQARRRCLGGLGSSSNPACPARTRSDNSAPNLYASRPCIHAVTPSMPSCAASAPSRATAASGHSRCLLAVLGDAASRGCWGADAPSTVMPCAAWAPAACKPTAACALHLLQSAETERGGGPRILSRALMLCSVTITRGIFSSAAAGAPTKPPCRRASAAPSIQGRLARSPVCNRPISQPSSQPALHLSTRC